MSKDAKIRNTRKEHFKTILNRPIPEEEGDMLETERNLDIDEGPIRLEEVLKATNHLETIRAL